MSFVLTFTPRGMTPALYDQIIQKLENAHAGHPKGRLYHVCFQSKDGLAVTDVWDSQENFDAFGEILMPILHSLGIDPGIPAKSEVYNIKGEMELA